MSTIFVDHNSYYREQHNIIGIEDAAHKHRTNMYTMTRLSKMLLKDACPSVRPSVRLSVCHAGLYSVTVETAKHIITSYSK